MRLSDRLTLDQALESNSHGDLSNNPSAPFKPSTTGLLQGTFRAGGVNEWSI